MTPRRFTSIQSICQYPSQLIQTSSCFQISLSQLQAKLSAKLIYFQTTKLKSQYEINITIFKLQYFKRMSCLEFDNPAFKIKVLDYTYTSEPSINTALPLKQSKIKTTLYIIAIIATFGFAWLLSKWSAKRKAMFTSTICQLEEATHFLIHDQDVEGETTMVQRSNKQEVRMKKLCPSFAYHDRNYIYIEEKEVFVPVRYQELGMHLDKLKKDKFLPMSDTKRTELLSYYGENVMRLPVRNRIQVFIQEMFTPFQVFQTYGIILWIYQEYYLFSFVLLTYSLYCYWKNSGKIQKNQQKLAFQSYFDVQTKVLINELNTPEEIYSERQEVQLCKNNYQVDEHKSEIIKDNFNGLEEADRQLEMTVKIGARRQTREVKNQENILINNQNARFKTISSHKLVPGDIIILNELDVVPCDCILLRGQALVDEKYSTGLNYLVRKQQIQNFTYIKQNESSFLLYLGTTIKKIKNNEFKMKRRTENQIDSIEHSIIKEENIDAANQLVCLVTQTNFNTLRGKFLRAIRYQLKQQEQFFKETIYFIYILLVIVTLVYFGYLKIIGPYTSSFTMFITYIDLIFVAIPPTLPTILMLGIQFVVKRLQISGINCVFPKSSLTGGKVNTIVLKGQQVFGKEYDIQSASIGTKGERGFGLTFSSVNQFYSYTDGDNISYQDEEELLKKKRQRSEFHKVGDQFINALASCHTLEFFQHEVEGSLFQKKIFFFSSCRNMSEDQFQTLNHKVIVHKIIRFKAKSMKLAVIATVKEKMSPLQQEQEELSNQSDLTKKINQSEHFSSKSQFEKQSDNKYVNSRKVIFLKGSAEKILQNCSKHTYPADAFEYIVDMAEKGFILFCYAMKEIHVDLKENFDYQEYINHSEFTFLGFIIMDQIKSDETLEAIKTLNESQVKLIYISELRQLQASSKAVTNGICNKNELLLCNITKNKQKIYCKGHIEWETSTSQIISEFITEFQDFGKNSKASLSAPLYNELCMKTESHKTDHLFDRTVIYNRMDLKCQKNFYTHLEKMNRVSCVVGSTGNVSECAHLSLQLQRQQSALLSNFYTQSKSLNTVVNCLRICRAGLSTNLQGFSMMILFTLIQFTTVTILNYNYETLTDDQMLYEDLIVTFPIFITLNLTQPATRLSKQLPQSSFFSLRNMLSMGGQLILQFLSQLGFILFVLSLDHFKDQREKSYNFYIENKSFQTGTALGLGLFILTNNLYLGIVLSTSVSKPFRKPFYTNPFYTLNVILLWCFNTLLVIFPKLSFSQLGSQDSSEQAQFVHVLALVVGNLVMVLMYLYENLLVFLWSFKNRSFSLRQNDELMIQQEPAISK